MEKTHEAEGGKQAKQRFTVALCGNAALEKAKTIIICMAQKALLFCKCRCDKNRSDFET